VPVTGPHGCGYERDRAAGRMTDKAAPPCDEGNCAELFLSEDGFPEVTIHHGDGALPSMTSARLRSSLRTFSAWPPPAVSPRRRHNNSGPGRWVNTGPGLDPRPSTEGSRIMTDTIPQPARDALEAAYTARAATAITRAARAEHDFAGWLVGVVAAAGQLGSSDALTEGRPGSWEASLVDQLVKGTVGYDDEYLPGPAGNRKLTDAQVRDIRWRYDNGIGGITQRALAAEFAVSASTVSAIVTGKSWGWLA